MSAGPIQMRGIWIGNPPYADLTPVQAGIPNEMAEEILQAMWWNVAVTLRINKTSAGGNRGHERMR